MLWDICDARLYPGCYAYVGFRKGNCWNKFRIGSDVCVVPDMPPAAVSVRTVVAEVWMERFVLVPEVCPVVSMTSTVARMLGPALSEEYSPVVLAGGGGGAVAAAYPLVMVESDTV